MGDGSHPISEYVLRDLLHEAGFQEVTRYFGAFLVEGWFAIKAWLSLL
ncbi:SAM-dependent methyltransferase [Paenibacillus sp. FSL H8-457]|nr:SAM-dependent methyltransferase [Paenibacillus sp. FSL H8-457]